MGDKLLGNKLVTDSTFSLSMTQAARFQGKLVGGGGKNGPAAMMNHLNFGMKCYCDKDNDQCFFCISFLRKSLEMSPLIWSLMAFISCQVVRLNYCQYLSTMVLKEYFEVRFVQKFSAFKYKGQGCILNQTESSCFIIIMTDGF